MSYESAVRTASDRLNAGRSLDRNSQFELERAARGMGREARTAQALLRRAAEEGKLAY